MQTLVSGGKSKKKRKYMARRMLFNMYMCAHENMKFILIRCSRHYSFRVRVQSVLWVIEEAVPNTHLWIILP